MSTRNTTQAPRLPWNPADPYPFYERRRRDGDIVWDDTAQAWLVLGYHAARQVLGEPGWTSETWIPHGFSSIRIASAMAKR